MKKTKARSPKPSKAQSASLFPDYVDATAAPNKPSAKTPAPTQAKSATKNVCRPRDPIPYEQIDWNGKGIFVWSPDYVIDFWENQPGGHR